MNNVAAEDVMAEHRQPETLDPLTMDDALARIDCLIRERDEARAIITQLTIFLGEAQAEATRLRAALEHISKQAREVCLKPEFKNVLGQPLCFSCEDVLPNHSEPNSDCLGWAGNVAERALAAVPNDPRPEWDTAERICAKLYAEAARLRAALIHNPITCQERERCTLRADALAATPSDTLAALRELFAACMRAPVTRHLCDDPRLAWLRRC